MPLVLTFSCNSREKPAPHLIGAGIQVGRGFAYNGRIMLDLPQNALNYDASLYVFSHNDVNKATGKTFPENNKTIHAQFSTPHAPLFP